MIQLRRYACFSYLVLAILGITISQSKANELTVGEKQFVKALGRDCPVIKLWSTGKVPDEPKVIGEETFQTEDEKRNRTGLMRISNVSDPSMIIITPSNTQPQAGVTLMLCPGGGYGSLGTETVKETAEWMNAKGITVVLLKYRVPKRHNGFEMNHQPLQDAQRAMGILRSRAKEWNIAPNKIGIGGFSAGGHLAASLSINHAKRYYQPIDEFDQISCRPDFSVLLYPAYLTDPILSRKHDAKLHYDRINSKDTPPTFISITEPDKFTIGSIKYYLALMQAKVKAELHIYSEGGHGGAIKKYPFGEWANECHRFLTDQGFLEGDKRPVPFQYKAKTLEDIKPVAGLTLGDQRLRQILGRDCPVIPLWGKNLGPDDKELSGDEVVTARSRGGNALNIRNVSRPTITVVQPKKFKTTKRAVIVCPGGGYGGLAAEHEGVKVCEWLHQQGITGILLKYRVPRRGGSFPKHHHALQDLQRAIRIVRGNAAKWGLATDQIGVCGFSAGGHLCATLYTNFEQNSYTAIDENDKLSTRPDFAILVYPAYFTEPRNSNEVDPLFANLKRNQTPPLFLTSAENDSFTHGMLNFYLNVQEAKVPAECHVYSSGGHGGGIDPISYPSSEWTHACERWLTDLQAKDQ